MKPISPPPAPHKAVWDPEASPASDETKWSARIDSYFSTHAYRCQVCSLAGEQRPEGDNAGPIRVYHLSREWHPGDEPDEVLAAMCKPCAQETRYFSNLSGEPFQVVVQRFIRRHQRTQRRRQDVIAQQVQERAYQRARRQQWRDEVARRKQAGITLDAEFRAEYADVYQPRSSSTLVPRGSLSALDTASDQHVPDSGAEVEGFRL